MILKTSLANMQLNRMGEGTVFICSLMAIIIVDLVG